MRFAAGLYLLAVLSIPANADSALLDNVRQLTFEGKRAGEGYFSQDGTKMVFQSEREPENPFYQIYLMDMETGDIDRVSPGHGKTTCAWLHPSNKKVLFASTQDDPAAREKMRAELEFRASGKARRYSWDYDPAYDIQVMDLETGAYQNLTKIKGYDAEGAYSPDGTRIVFASNRAAFAGELSAADAKLLERDPAFFMDIYTMDADGGDVRRLTNAPGYDGGPFWSADGKKIIWRRFSADGARAEIYTMNADGSGERQITDLGVLSWAPYFHPSGDYVIFATNKQGFANFELYMVDAEGKREPVRVTDRVGFDGLPVFTPDGRRLSWTSRPKGTGSQIFIADWNDAEARRLLGLPGQASSDVQAPKPRMDQTAAAIRADDLKAHVAALASDEMAGRLTGTAGEKVATAYVAEAFKALGLVPAGDAGGYFQEFPFTAGVSLGDGNDLEIGGAELPELVLDKTWRPLAFSRTGASERAGIVFAGFGLVAPASGDHATFDSYGDTDISGKWVLVWRGMPNQIDAEQRVHLSRFADLRYKASVARSKGAAGMIVAPAPGIDYADELPKLSYESASGLSGLPVLAVNRAVADKLLSAVRSAQADMTEALDKGAQTAAVALDGVTATARVALTFEKRQGRNVLGLLDLGAPEHAPLLVIGAHVDHLGRGETSGSLARSDEKGQIHYGADDNASGVAALIEIAQKMASDRQAGKLKGVRNVLFAAWSGEELGLLGSSYFVDGLAKKAGQEDLKGLVSAYLNMDMVGRLRDKLTLSGLGSSDVWRREIERRNAVVGLPVAPSDDTYLPTDATEFYLAGVPILAAFTGAHEEYSTPRDTAETLNYEGLEKIARLMALIARSQARGKEAPSYVAVKKPSGERARRMSGVFLGTIPDYTEEGQSGVPLSGVVKGGPADKAGLTGGDVIVGFAGVPVENIYDYVRVLNGLKVGETVDVVVLRKGEKVILPITPAIRE